jgi:hypothetical protein
MVLTPLTPIHFILLCVSYDDTKSAVLVQCPSNWDSVCVLAQLQEEVCEAGKRLVFRCPDHYTMSQQSAPSPMPMPPHHSRWASKEMIVVPLVLYVPSPLGHRRVHGLCIKCADSIHLNVVQELFEVFQWEDDLQSTSLQEDKSPHEQVFLLVSATASCFWCSWFSFVCCQSLGNLQHITLRLLPKFSPS